MLIKANRKDKSWYQNPRIFLVLGTLILIFSSFKFGQLLLKNHQLNQQIQSLEKDVQKLEEDQNNFKQELWYTNTNSYQEKRARDLLKYKKPEETVISIPHSSNQENFLLPTAITNEEKTPTPQKDEPNWILWYNFFRGQ